MNVLSSLLKFIAEGGLWSLTYPVGSYYETSDTLFDPNVTWGGEWVLEAAGQVHVSAGTGYAVSGALTNTTDGGSKDAKVPYHTHTMGTGGGHQHDMNSSVLGYTGLGPGYAASGSHYKWQNGQAFMTPFGGTHSHTINSAGESVTNANMPPYIVVNRWHRTA